MRQRNHRESRAGFVRFGRIPDGLVGQIHQLEDLLHLRTDNRTWSPEDLEAFSKTLQEERDRLKTLAHEVDTKVEAVGAARESIDGLQTRLSAVSEDQRRFEDRLRSTEPLVELLGTLEAKAREIHDLTERAENRLNEVEAHGERTLEALQYLPQAPRELSPQPPTSQGRDWRSLPSHGRGGAEQPGDDMRFAPLATALLNAAGGLRHDVLRSGPFAWRGTVAESGLAVAVRVVASGSGPPGVKCPRTISARPVVLKPNSS